MNGLLGAMLPPSPQTCIERKKHVILERAKHLHGPTLEAAAISSTLLVTLSDGK